MLSSCMHALYKWFWYVNGDVQDWDVERSPDIPDKSDGVAESQIVCHMCGRRTQSYCRPELWQEGWHFPHSSASSFLSNLVGHHESSVLFWEQSHKHPEWREPRCLNGILQSLLSLVRHRCEGLSKRNKFLTKLNASKFNYCIHSFLNDIHKTIKQITVPIPSNIDLIQPPFLNGILLYLPALLADLETMVL